MGAVPQVYTGVTGIRVNSKCCTGVITVFFVSRGSRWQSSNSQSLSPQTYLIVCLKSPGCLASSRAEHRCSAAASGASFSSPWPRLLLHQTHSLVDSSLFQWWQRCHQQWQTLILQLSYLGVGGRAPETVPEFSLASLVSRAHPCTSRHGLSLIGQTRSCVHH